MVLDGWCQMSFLASTAPHKEDEETRGGPIGGLVIAVPASLLLWGIMFFVLLNLIR